MKKIIIIAGFLFLFTSCGEEKKEFLYNNSIACQQLNQSVIEGNMVPLDNCELLDKVNNKERVKGGFRYGYSKDAAGTGFFICDITFSESNIFKERNCWINKNDLEPLN